MLTSWGEINYVVIHYELTRNGNKTDKKISLSEDLPLRGTITVVLVSDAQEAGEQSASSSVCEPCHTV